MFRKGIKFYLIASGLIFNLAMLAVGGFYFSDKITSTWRWKQVTDWWRGPIDRTGVVDLARVPTGLVNPAYSRLPTGKWIKIHQQKSGDRVQFVRQSHAGSAFDTRRGELILFGSNTHGKNWDNAIYFFNMARIEWRRAYPADPRSSYSVSNQGIPVAGKGENHPWAMHTYDALVYDQKNDALVVASLPGHLKPGRFGNWMQGLWEKARKHPTWIYNLKTNQWIYSDTKVVDFFPYATAYDTTRDLAVGFKPFGIHEFLGMGSGWKRVGEKSYYAYHTSAVYDSKNHQFVLFGGNTLENSVYTYRPGDKAARKMPTPGLRPKGTQSQPMAFHERLGKTVVMIDRGKKSKGISQTWLYDSGLDQWERVEGADFPYRLGMNYGMQYDPANNLLVLVASPPGEATSVWALALPTMRQIPGQDAL